MWAACDSASMTAREACIPTDRSELVGGSSARPASDMVLAHRQGQGHLEPRQWPRQDGSLSLVIKWGHAQAVLECCIHVTQGQAADPAIIAAARLPVLSVAVEWCWWQWVVVTR